MEKFHYEGMDGKSEAAQESSLVETYFAMSKGTRFFTQTTKTNPSLVKKLKPIPKHTKGTLV